MSSQSREQGVPEIRILTAAPNPSPNALKIQEHFVRVFSGHGGNVYEVPDTFTENMTFYAAPSLPWGGPLVGREGFRVLIDRFRENISGAACPDPVTLYDAGDMVIADFTMVYTSSRSDRDVSVPYLESFRFDGDRVTEVRPYPHDSAAMVEFLKEEVENNE